MPASAMARRLGVTTRDLKTATEQGIVPAVKLGNSAVYDVDAVEAELSKRAREQGGQDRE